MKVQCLMLSPTLNAVEHDLIRSDFVRHCFSCIICIYHIAFIMILLSKSDDLTL